MLWNAKNGSVPLGNTEMQYAVFGSGDKTLIILPGLSDGLATVKGKALVLAKPYSKYLKHFRIFMFSRKDEMPDDYSINDMASDQAEALCKLGLKKVSVLGVSQGGLIAQCLAIDYPDLVEKLVLAVSAPCVNQMTENCLNRWIGYAKQGDHKSLMIDTAENTYSESYLKKFRLLYPIIGKIGKPADYRRFLINAEAILGFDASNNLNRISCPTLIIGGADDKIVGAEASFEMNKRISGSNLFVYPEYGHGAFEEAGDFNNKVFRFLEESPR